MTPTVLLGLLYAALGVTGGFLTWWLLTRHDTDRHHDHQPSHRGPRVLP